MSAAIPSPAGRLPPTSARSSRSAVLRRRHVQPRVAGARRPRRAAARPPRRIVKALARSRRRLRLAPVPGDALSRRLPAARRPGPASEEGARDRPPGRRSRPQGPRPRARVAERLVSCAGQGRRRGTRWSRRSTLDGLLAAPRVTPRRLARPALAQGGLVPRLAAPGAAPSQRCRATAGGGRALPAPGHRRRRRSRRGDRPRAPAGAPRSWRAASGWCRATRCGASASTRSSPRASRTSASDSQAGFNSAIFLRTVKLKDFPWNGWLRLGIAGEARRRVEPDRRLQRPGGTAALGGARRSGDAPRARTARLGGEPRDGDVASGHGRRRRRAGGRAHPRAGHGAAARGREGARPRAARITYRVAASAFHDGTRMTAADAVYPYLFAARWGASGRAGATTTRWSTPPPRRRARRSSASRCCASTPRSRSTATSPSPTSCP